ncbi:MAG TPA: copper chaperone PCu(A)C [Candidatus Agrococcus pullicola]|uniref:Copper chaperone PCu(A)C n=1 Tax=Candidatus Agrococcus pullicola TaxID=2838429 RepID=A0A9D1YSU4_9MICO|nr:copper chaperone PCu(A)C [Candidatus Agrococcus pullicola]
MHKNIKNTRVTGLATVSVAGVALAGFVLTGCSTAAEELSVTDPWVRSEAGEMTAMFGEIENTTGSDLLIDSIDTDVAESVEMHEMIENENGSMVMQEIEGGFSIPAGETLALEPGGDHFMFIGLHDDLLAGETVTVTVHFEDGEPLTIEATVKDFPGGNEPYDDDGEGHGESEGHGEGHDDSGDH